jgi:hypothetical protein
MKKKPPDALREQLVRLLSWHDAHVGFDEAVEGIPPKLRGVRPSGMPYSAWELLEHMRLAQRDILEFCIDPHYRERTFPDDYWPKSPAPRASGDWQKSVVAYRRDRKALERLVAEPDLDLHERIPHGDGQTFLREVLLVADHGAYHLGELVAVRRLLGAWKQ